MTAVWSVDSEIFLRNATKVKNNQLIMAIIKNNTYHYGLEFAIRTFLEAGIHTFSTTFLKEVMRIHKLTSYATIFLMNTVYDFDTIRNNNIQMTLPSSEHYYQYKSELKDISVHLESENLLHRSGFKSLDEIKEVLHHHENDNGNKMNIVGLWTHSGYAGKFDVPEYGIKREAWLNVVNTLLDEGYQFELIHAQNSASYYREGQQPLPYHTHARVDIVLYGSRPCSKLGEHEIEQALTVKGDIIQAREVNKGDYCGYSFAFEAMHDHTHLTTVDIGYGGGILKKRATREALINGKRYPIRASMMSHMFVEVDDDVHAQDEVILYNNDIYIDEYILKGVGTNSEQLSVMNHDSLIKELR